MYLLVCCDVVVGLVVMIGIIFCILGGVVVWIGNICIFLEGRLWVMKGIFLVV